MKRAVLGLKERLSDTTFLCLSNSNNIYIGTILEVLSFPPLLSYSADQKKHNLTDLFHTIICNPASWSPSSPNLLSVGRRLPATEPPHGCEQGCLANMCKGNELDTWLSQNGGWEGYDRVTYIGDGGNDFCPLLRMRKGDWALVRKNMELDGRVKEEGQEKGLKVDVKRWEGAWEVEEYFQQL